MPELVPRSDCLSDQQVDEFFRGASEVSALASTEAHLDSCATCRLLVAQVAKVYASSPAPSLTSVLQGTTIGRYIVLNELGSGAMGVVYAAQDTELDRKVALKLLRGNDSPSMADTANVRMLREAQAMAKLSHPNVVGIYEVGTIDDALFLAMEYVDGETLSDWLRAQERSVGDIVEVFVNAGRGLGAAHNAGLVHRDFKPQNVLIGSDGRPRVTDFGLVGVAGVFIESDSTSDSSGPLHLTRTGEVMGTPAFMAPEQFEGGTTDARSDQFSFCVALYQALYGKLPFSGSTFGDLMISVAKGKVQDAPQGSNVPMWTRSLLLRGLATSPDNRYPSMDALLQELIKAPQALRKRRLIAGGGIVGFVALAGLAVFAFSRGTSNPDAVCTGAQGEMAGIWDDVTRLQVKASFRATKRPYADDTYVRIDKSLSAYSAAWVGMHTGTCEATHVQGSQSDTLLDLRMQCLDRRLGEFAALTRAFANEATAGTVDDAVRISSTLIPLDGCADVEALSAAIPLPDDPRDRSRVKSLYGRLNEARASQSIANYAEALVVARDVVKESSAVDYPPLAAKALYLTGSLESLSGDFDLAEETLRKAARAAAEARLDDEIAMSWTKLIFVVGHQQSKFDDALGIQSYAEAAVARSPRSKALGADLMTDLATVHIDKGNHAEAQTFLEQALAISEELNQNSGYQVAYIHNSLAIVARRQGKYDESLGHYESALEIWTAALGPEHPLVGTVLMNLAPVLAILGKTDKAQTNLEQALGILERAYGEMHSTVGSCLANLGIVHRRQGNHDKAREFFVRALKVTEKAMGPDHPTVGNILFNLGNVELTAGNYDKAANYYQRTLELRTKLFGEDNAGIATAHYGLGDVLERQQNYSEALPHFEKSLAIWIATLGKTHPRVAIAQVGIGKCQIGLGQMLEGIANIERAIALRESGEGNLSEISEMRFVLAQALWPGQKGRAISLAKKVQAARAKIGQGEEKGLAEVDDWLKAHL